MKKLFVFMFLVLAALAVNAQRTPIKVSDLQKAIVDNISKDYAGFIIRDAAKIVENNMTNYEVAIVKGTTHESLLYDNNGKFIKKVVKLASASEKSNANKHEKK